MRNRTTIIGAVTEIELASPKYGNRVCTIDTADLPVVGKIRGSWVASYCPGTQSFYCQTQIKDKTLYGTKCLGIHRLIMGLPDTEIDHINHDTLDNRKANLRLADRSENMQNKMRALSTSRTGVLGVYWEPDRQKYRAELTVFKKKIRIGRFDSLHDASEAVIRARAELFPFSQEALSRKKVFQYANA
ncbi:hypothetical protein OBV_43200 [Oscillibacter valericigenes Sjm18-20]|nr:hypothetical protein OBV_01870 [Oscillibacter valericigenes Sjm18-20]BAL01519.1 hypothetical protein OBV_43200 [Oscillibacter valericigenes Sjm18-20]